MSRSPHASRDAKARQLLAERGDGGQTPRHTLFYFYGDNLDRLHEAAIAAGYKVRLTAVTKGLVLETTIAVDEETFEEHAQRMEAWADEFNCKYDGWECQVVNQ